MYVLLDQLGNYFYFYNTMPFCFRNILHSKKKMWNFKSIDTEALKRKNFILIVFKEKLKMSELPHELQTYYKLNLYVGPDENEDRLSAKIR